MVYGTYQDRELNPRYSLVRNQIWRWSNNTDQKPPKKLGTAAAVAAKYIIWPTVERNTSDLERMEDNITEHVYYEYLPLYKFP